MYLSMVCGMLVSVSLSINVSMFTVSNTLLMSNATAMVCVGGMGWLKLSCQFIQCFFYGMFHPSEGWILGCDT